jgi:hypothetical protein
LTEKVYMKKLRRRVQGTRLKTEGTDKLTRRLETEKTI